VQVRCDEGVANHIDPKPCAGFCEEVGEASAGGRAGQPLSHDIEYPRAPTLSKGRKATRKGALYASVLAARRGQRTWHAHKLLVREPGDLGFDQPQLRAGPRREGEEP